MDKLPVGQLPDLKQSNNDDEIMVITDSEHNQLKKEKISDFITDLTSTDENNAIVKGTDGKLFTKDFGNASNITEGTLPTSVLPEIPLEKLPVSGVSADTYAYPSSVTVNSQGQVTAIEAGEPGANNANQDLSNISEAGKEVIRETAGSDYHLTQNQITNCMLSAPNGVPSYSGNTITVYGSTQFLFSNGRNSNNTLQNTTFTAASNITGTMSGSTAGTFVVFVTPEPSLIFANNINYFMTSTEPTALNDTTSQGVWFNPQTNLMYQCAATASTPSWSTFEGAICATLSYDGSAVTAFNPIYPISLLAADHSNDTVPYITETYENGTSWYRVWSDGWCEQGGKHISTTSGGSTLSATISLLKQYKDVNYGVLLTNLRLIDWAYSSLYSTAFKNDSTKVFTVQCVAVNGSQYIDGFYWHTIGYIS